MKSLRRFIARRFGARLAEKPSALRRNLEGRQGGARDN